MAENLFENHYSSDISSLLADPLTQMVMRADGVSEQQLAATLIALFAKLGRGSSSKPTGSAVTDPSAYRPGVGIMLLNRQNLVFVGKRRYIQGDAWQMPQGGIESGEDPPTAALRELQEEIGTSNAEIIAESDSWLFYALPSGIKLTHDNYGWRGQRQKWFAMRFLGRDSEINVNTQEPEFIDWKWVQIDELPELIVSYKRLVYLSVLEEFQEMVRSR